MRRTENGALCALNAHLRHGTAATIPGTGNASVFQVETEMNTGNVKAVMTQTDRHLKLSVESKSYNLE